MPQDIRMSVAISIPNFNEIDTKIYKRLGKLMDKELDKIENTFKPAHRTWSAKSKPEWKKKRDNALGRDELVFEITTDSTPFVWVNSGTSRGHVTFSRNFLAKTKPGVLGSGAGRGKVLKRGVGPVTRIRARGFDELVAERRQPHFSKASWNIIESELTKILSRSKNITFIASTR